MERIIPISDLQSQARRYVDQVRKTGIPVVITQRGRAAAVLADYATYEGHLATLEEMSYPDWRMRLSRAERELASGKGIPLEHYLHRRKHRKPKASWRQAA